MCPFLSGFVLTQLSMKLAGHLGDNRHCLWGSREGSSES
jgi:hypothetical protein